MFEREISEILDMRNQESLMELIINTFEKQLPKKPLPIFVIKGKRERLVSYQCPSCENSSLGNGEYRNKYCENCGQKLDWEG